MRLKNTHIIVLAATILLMAFAQNTFAAVAGDASILYTENQDGNLWRYDYIFKNNSETENLFAVRLYFGDSYNISSPSLPDAWTGAWGIKSNTSLMETHTYNTSSDVAPKSDMVGFSFTVDSQVGDIDYRAYFYDQSSTTSSVSGTTSVFASGGTPPVVPEPVSSILFITGGAALALRKRFRRKK